MVHGGMAQDVGPILKMVTEKYLLRSEAEWQGRLEAMTILDQVVDLLQQGDIRQIGARTQRNFEGPLQTIIPWATNMFTERLIQQVTDGNTLYDHPETSFVASFVGENNLFRGTVSEADAQHTVVETNVGPIRARTSSKAQLNKGESAFVFVRPESLKFANGASADNRIKATVHTEEFEGHFWQVFLDVPGGDKRIKMSLVNDGTALGHAPGAERHG